MRTFKVEKQGIEVEVQVLDRENPLEKINSPPTPSIEHWHPDDGKSEYSSIPQTDLGDLENELHGAMTHGMEYLLAHRTLSIPIGCQPFLKDFASGHIHTSVNGMDKETWKELRQKLFSAQPLIALLSQNSPVLHSLRAADVRLLLSTWSSFTDFDSNSQSHYQSLAFGQGGSTLEVRIPSSGPLFQLLAIAAFVRVIVENNEAPIPILPTKENWTNVINYGSSSLCEIGIPFTLAYDGVKYKSSLVKTTDLFKIFYEDNKGIFEEKIAGINSAVRGQIIKFYEFISSGLTLSDTVFAMYKKYEPVDFLRNIYDLFYQSYVRTDIFPMLPEATSFMPVVEKYYTISELKDAIASMKEAPFSKKIELMKKDNLALFTSRGILRNRRALDILSYIVSNGMFRASTEARVGDIAILRQLVLNNIVKENKMAKSYFPGDNLPIVLCMAKSAGLI